MKKTKSIIEEYEIENEFYHCAFSKVKTVIEEELEIELSEDEQKATGRKVRKENRVENKENFKSLVLTKLNPAGKNKIIVDAKDENEASNFINLCMKMSLELSKQLVESNTSVTVPQEAHQRRIPRPNDDIREMATAMSAYDFPKSTPITSTSDELALAKQQMSKFGLDGKVDPAILQARADLNDDVTMSQKYGMEGLTEDQLTTEQQAIIKNRKRGLSNSMKMDQHALDQLKSDRSVSGRQNNTGRKMSKQKELRLRKQRGDF